MTRRVFCGFLEWIFVRKHTGGRCKLCCGSYYGVWVLVSSLVGVIQWRQLSGAGK